MGRYSAYRAIEDMGFFCYSGADGDLYRKNGLAGWRVSLSHGSYRIQHKRKGNMCPAWWTVFRIEGDPDDINAPLDEQQRRAFVEKVGELVENGEVETTS